MRVKYAVFLVTLLTLVNPVGAQTLLPDPIMTPSSEQATWEATLAQDENLDTDWASSGQGTATQADFDFGGVVRITQMVYTDRRNAGGPNGPPAEQGCADDVLTYNLIFSTDATFGNGDDVTQSVTSSVCPTFVDTVLINGGNGYYARYVRWDVTSINGGAVNNGAAEFDFFTGSIAQPAEVPAMSTWALLALAGAIVAFAFVRLR